MHKFILCLLLICSLSSTAQWTNLSFEPDQENIELNPLKGFSDLYNDENDFPSSIGSQLFGLDQVMIGLGDYNWEAIDNFIAQNKSEGKFSTFQVNIDPGPDSETGIAGSYMPAFLDGQYDFFDYDGSISGVADICPDWNDPEIIEAMLDFIHHFGLKYNGDPDVFFINLGLYGIYGEWQIGDVVEFFPEYEMTEANKTIIANAFVEAFPETNLLARFPKDMPDAQLFGFSDGLFFTQSTHPSLQFEPNFFNNVLINYNAFENWRNHPIGGEIAPCVQPEIWDVWPNSQISALCGPDDPSGGSDVQDVVATINTIRPTFLFTHHIFLNQVTEGSAEWNNAIMAQKLMGYTFWVDQFRLSASNGIPAMEVNIQNKGVAPMYGNWTIEFALKNVSTGEVDTLGTADWNIQTIMPDDETNYRSFISTESVNDGTYRFMFRMINPLSASSPLAEPVRFANTLQDADEIGWLTLGEAAIIDGSLNSGLPQSVSSISLSQTTATISVGGPNLALNATVLPIEANADITWVSDHPMTAQVDQTGNVTAGPAYGPVKVYAYSNGGNAVAVCDIEVKPFTVPIPGIVEAENYIRKYEIAELGFKLGFIEDRDWVQYAVSVSTPSEFLVDVLYSREPMSNGQVSIIRIDEQSADTLDTVSLPTTNSFNTFEVATSQVITLSEGEHILRFYADTGKFDLDRFDFILQDADGDGISDGFDCAPNDMLIYEGAICDDGDDNTEEDVIQEDCSCAGVPINSCLTDFNLDGTTNGDDFSILLGNFGLPCDPNTCKTDLNGDGNTDGVDFSVFLGNFGLDCN